MYYIPVINQNLQPLMPTHPGKARRLIKCGKAIPFWKNGIYCIKLTNNIDNPHLQQVIIGVDPGSKKEGITIKSSSHTYLNVQADARTGIKEKVETRSQMRRARRTRNCRRRPCRSNNRKQPKIIPSTFARWNWKLRIIKFFSSIFPIVDVVVEDIKAKTKGKKKWDKMFSPLEVGKKWFYSEIQKTWNLTLVQGYETKQLRDIIGLKKSNNKMSNDFSAHCVDSWVLSNSVSGGHIFPDNTDVFCVAPFNFTRRQLHKLQFSKGKIRQREGGTVSLGLKRGTLVKHIKHGLSYVGGYINDRISLHNLKDGKRICQNAKISDCQILSRLLWRYN